MTPTPRPLPQRLRVGLFADGTLQPAWMVDSFSRISRSDFAEIALIAVVEPERGHHPPAPLLRAYRYLDAWAFTGRRPSRTLLDIRHIAHDRCITLPRATHMASDGWRKRLGTDAALDVAFVLGEIDTDHLRGLARYGIWSHCFGADLDCREDSAGCHEVLEGQAITRSGLGVRHGEGQVSLRVRSWSRTYPLSAARNREYLLNKTALFAERELRKLQQSGTIDNGRPTPAEDDVPGPPRDLPNTIETLRGVLRVGSQIAARAIQKLHTVEQWFIAYRFGAGPPDGHRQAYVRLQPPGDRLWADPFPLYRDGRYFLFFEEVMFASGKGHICVSELTPDGSYSPPVKILERDHHLSYPFLIESDGALFMVPEAGQSRRIDLYRCQRFPDIWTFEKTLLEGFRWADATFHHDGERWWMFIIIGAPGTELFDELHLFHAHDLLGEWHAHPCNPVKSDARSARPAGRPFERDGMLLRPAQICAPRYGSGIAITRITHLSPERYEERVLERLLPEQGQDVMGVHTLNRSGDLNVIDGWEHRSRLGESRRQHLFITRHAHLESSDRPAELDA